MNCLGRGMGEGGVKSVGMRRGRIVTLEKHEIHESDLAKRFNMYH